MRIEDAEPKLSAVHTQEYSIAEFDQELEILKKDLVKKDDQTGAKKVWVLQTIAKIHRDYLDAFTLLKSKEYYDGWCKLEKVEITISSLKKHFSYDKQQYFLWHIEKSIANLQVLFPYRLFASTEYVYKKVKCTTCNTVTSLRNPCGHIVGEIYNGEMCMRAVVEAEIIGIAVVENPGNKYSVMHRTDNDGDDNLNYKAVDFLFKQVESPYQHWDLEVSQREHTKEDYGNIGRNDLCSCGSQKKFKKCCSVYVGKKYPHYSILYEKVG